MENKNYGIDAEAELMKLLAEEMNKTKEEKYSEIKEILSCSKLVNKLTQEYLETKKIFF